MVDIIDEKRIDIIDVNTWLGAWPFRYFDEDSPDELDTLMQTEGVVRAYVASTETVFNYDCPEANRRLLESVKGFSRLRPVVTINPTITGWKDLIRKYRDDGIEAVRIIPNYHDYECNAGGALEFVEQIAKEGTFALTLQIRMEDERTHNMVCRVPGTPSEHIVDLANRFPEVNIIALCAYFHEAAEISKATRNVLFELSHIETMRTVTSLLRSVPVERVLYGSHAPFLYARAATMKLMAPDVPDQAQRAIAAENAARVFP